MLVLGIETSCDETAASVVEDGVSILSNVVATQTEVHSRFGGVVPELASRRHVQNIIPVILKCLSDASLSLDEIDGIAVTQGPGLIGSLLIGISVAKSISYAKGLPIVGVNHLEAHIYSNFLEHSDLEPPFISLLVSGGHTELMYICSRFRPTNGRKEYGNREYEKLGQTMDDAAGEAFDKVAKLLELGYPGGPIIDKLSAEGDPKSVAFPRPYVWDHSLNFSFSGLKTAVLNYVISEKKSGREFDIPDICASFQAAVIDVLTEKALYAAKAKGADTITLAGGVAANRGLRKRMSERCHELGIRLYYPSPILCTDNAAMVAGIGYHLLTEAGGLGLDSDAIKSSANLL